MPSRTSPEFVCNGITSDQVIAELNAYIQGWKAYYQVGISRTRGDELNAWILRRLRAYIWEQWKLPRTKIRNLQKLGVMDNWVRSVR